MKDDRICFIDTNVLVYAFDKSEAKKNGKAKQLLERCFKGETLLAASTQTLSEFFVVATKKIQRPITGSQAKNIIQKIIEFKRFSILTIKPGTIVSAINTCNETNTHYWDCLIAETMKENSMYQIYTENTKDFRKISGIKTINPFQKI